MALAGYSARVKISGAAVAIVAEAMGLVSSGVYQVTNTARRIFDPSVAVTIKDGGVTVSSSLYSFDYLFGIVTFNGHTVTGAVTVDGSYLPVAAIAEVRGFSFSGTRELLDSTTQDNTDGWRKKTPGLLDASGSLDLLSTPLDDLDPVTGGTQTLADVFNNGTAKLLEITLGSRYLRAWIIFEGFEESAAVEGLVESSVSYQSAPQRLGASVAFGS